MLGQILRAVHISEGIGLFARKARNLPINTVVFAMKAVEDSVILTRRIGGLWVREGKKSE
jgi:hypothetical protein